MALTATAQSALPREPAWEDLIVPLRQRLRNESHALAKRMSEASMTSTGDQPSETFQPEFTYPEREQTSSPSSHQQQKFTAIPRPSLQYSRNPDGHSGSISRPAHFQRTRTTSQPFSLDLAVVTSPSRSDSPLISRDTVTKATRIPMSRARTASTSSSVHPTTVYRNGISKSNGSALSATSESIDGEYPSYSSRSTTHIPPHQSSGILNETMSFNTGSTSSRGGNEGEMGRLSNDSEEAPFEHWYRGDISRNGGVGELRVGRRQEMLEIANYGHTFRQASQRIVYGSGARSRSNSRGNEAAEASRRARQRAGSVGARQSIYLDEDDQAKQAAMVFDEQPPTDLENDNIDDHMDVYSTPESRTATVRSQAPATQTESPSEILKQPTRTRIPTPVLSTQSRYKIPTPTVAARGGSEPPSAPSAPVTPRVAKSVSQPGTRVQNSPSSTKRRAKSPAAATSASATKKPKTKSPPSNRKIQREEQNRRSIAQYPEYALDGEDVTDAIPVWTQPVEVSGNWDDVVIPVVARKKGLDEHYEQVDGASRRKPKTEIIEPAPGTFGYDHSKYRPPKTNLAPENIPMDEFGQRKVATEETSEVSDPPAKQPEPYPSRSQTSQSPDRARSRGSPPPSPPPFSHYISPPQSTGITPTATPAPPPLPPQDEEEEDAKAGCCKCVIM